MAAPSDLSCLAQFPANGTNQIDALRVEFNKLVTNLRVLTAKLDADAGVTDTNYAALVTDSAASGPAKIGLFNG